MNGLQMEEKKLFSVSSDSDTRLSFNGDLKAAGCFSLFLTPSSDPLNEVAV